MHGVEYGGGWREGDIAAGHGKVVGGKQKELLCFNKDKDFPSTVSLRAI